MASFATFRRWFRAVTPIFQDPVSEKIVYSIGLVFDANTEWLRQGILARMPLRAVSDALPVIGTDRLIPQGFAEPAASYALRLSKAFDSWAHAGSARGLLQQLLGYVSPAHPLVRTVNNGTAAEGNKWDWLDNAVGSLDLIPTTHYTSPRNWDWDGDSTSWWRVWVLIYTSVWASEGDWGDGQLWGDGGTWGTTATLEQVRTVRALVSLWKAQHVYVPWIVIALDDALFSPTAGAIAPMPDGTWGHWGHDVAGNYEPAREANARYWDGVQ